jgi:cellobiose transport system permease protein
MTSTVGTPTQAPPAVPSPRPPSARRWAARRGRWDIKFSPYLYVAPFFLIFGAFNLFPVIYTTYVSMYDWSLIRSGRSFVGFDNYAEVLGDEQFWTAVTNTVGIFVVSTVPQLLAALAIANVLNRQLRARTLFRMAVLVPNFTSVAAVGIVFGLLFAEQYGMINWLLDSVGLNGVEWRSHSWSSWLAISAMVDWRWVGYNALIYLAAMQAIPRDLYEASAIDGAGRWRQFWQVTIPMIRPTVLFTVIISTIGGMQLFTEPYMFAYGRSTGGVNHEYQTVAMYIYEKTFEGNFEYGYGSAVSWLLFLMIVIFALINFLLVRRTVGGETR